MRFASEGGVEWRQASGGAEQQPGRVAASLLLQGDLPAQVLRLGRRVGAQLRSLECDEKPQRRFEVPGIPLRPDSCEKAFRAARRFECQLGRALEKGGSRSQAAARLRPSRGAVELLGDVLRSEERRVGKECRSRWSP